MHVGSQGGLKGWASGDRHWTVPGLSYQTCGLRLPGVAGILEQGMAANEKLRKDEMCGPEYGV